MIRGIKYEYSQYELCNLGGVVSKHPRMWIATQIAADSLVVLTRPGEYPRTVQGK